jgi:hypothetical protein
MRYAPMYGYAGPQPWARPKGKWNGWAKNEDVLADGASAPFPHLVACRCGNRVKASILRKRPAVLCNWCGSSFPLDARVSSQSEDKEPRVSQSVNAAPWHDAARLARVREAPGIEAAAASVAMGAGSEKDCMQVELDEVLKFIAQVEHKATPNLALLASLREEEAAIKARMAAVPAPVLDRSALTRKLNSLTGAVARAENEKKQQVASYDKELAALKVRIEKIARAEQVLANAEKEFAEVQAQLAVASPPPGSLPLFATVQQLQAYLVQNPSVVEACLGEPNFAAHFTPVPLLTPAATTPGRVEEETVEGKRSADLAFGGDDGLAPMATDGTNGTLPVGGGESERGRSRSPDVHALAERPLCSSFDATANAKRELAEAMESHP